MFCISKPYMDLNDNQDDTKLFPEPNSMLDVEKTFSRERPLVPTAVKEKNDICNTNISDYVIIHLFKALMIFNL